MDAKEFRDVGHRAVDFLAEYLDHIEEKRVFPDTEPRTLNELLALAELPREGVAAALGKRASKKLPSEMAQFERAVRPIVSVVIPAGGLQAQKRRFQRAHTL